MTIKKLEDKTRKYKHASPQNETIRFFGGTIYAGKITTGQAE